MPSHLPAGIGLESTQFLTQVVVLVVLLPIEALPGVVMSSFQQKETLLSLVGVIS